MTEMTTTSALELRVAGMMRSGNHAIIEWILEQHRNKSSVFLNNVAHGPQDPYRTADRILVNGSEFEGDIDECRKSKKNLLVYSYEDRGDSPIQSSLIRSAFSEEFEDVRVQFLGSSARAVDVLVVRDPLNCFASRLRQYDLGRTGAASFEPEMVRDRWIDFAEYCTGAMSNDNPKQIVIPYNRWLTDPSFRRSLSRSLAGTYSDATLASTSDFGGGSSFERRRLPWGQLASKWRRISSPRAWRSLPGIIRSQISPKKPGKQTLSRWRGFENDSRFAVMTENPRVFELSRAIFGDIYGSA
ncbi:MAG: hypothetical protein VX672_07185 [Planctomycetota bacterium]|nr:hypothetical protein [Planctomycetota bacterium]